MSPGPCPGRPSSFSTASDSFLRFLPTLTVTRPTARLMLQHILDMQYDDLLALETLSKPKPSPHIKTLKQIQNDRCALNSLGNAILFLSYKSCSNTVSLKLRLHGISAVAVRHVFPFRNCGADWTLLMQLQGRTCCCIASQQRYRTVCHTHRNPRSS